MYEYIPMHRLGSNRDLLSFFRRSLGLLLGQCVGSIGTLHKSVGGDSDYCWDSVWALLALSVKVLAETGTIVGTVCGLYWHSP